MIVFFSFVCLLKSVRQFGHSAPRAMYCDAYELQNLESRILCDETKLALCSWRSNNFRCLRLWKTYRLLAIRLGKLIVNDRYHHDVDLTRLFLYYSPWGIISLEYRDGNILLWGKHQEAKGTHVEGGARRTRTTTTRLTRCIRIPWSPLCYKQLASVCTSFTEVHGRANES